MGAPKRQLQDIPVKNMLVMTLSIFQDLLHLMEKREEEKTRTRPSWVLG